MRSGRKARLQTPRARWLRCCRRCRTRRLRTLLCQLSCRRRLLARLYVCVCVFVCCVCMLIYICMYVSMYACRRRLLAWLCVCVCACACLTYTHTHTHTHICISYLGCTGVIRAHVCILYLSHSSSCISASDAESSRSARFSRSCLLVSCHQPGLAVWTLRVHTWTLRALCLDKVEDCLVMRAGI